MYKAIENQDYDFIANALKNSETLKKNIQENIQKLEQQLAIEEARGAEASESTIQYIKSQIAALKDVDNFYLASLDLRLEAEQEQLNEYKTLLEQQNDALVKSLEERKAAYEDYFSKINEAEESIDYIEQAELLERNLSRIAADSGGAAGQQRAELEKQLEDLAKERAQELRQQAQEQIIENIDDQIEQANKTLENILNSQQALLTAFTNDINSDGWGSMVASMIASKNATEGFTELSAEKYIQDLQGTFGAKADVN